MNKARQNCIIATAVIVMSVFFLMQLIPGTIGNGLALILALFVVSVAIYGLFVVSRKSKLSKMIAVAVPILVVVWVLSSQWPSLQRARLQHQLEATGATVICRVNDCEAGWFRSGRLLLPCWTKDWFGESYFGDIRGVQHSEKSIAQIQLVDVFVPLEFVTFPRAVISANDARFLSRQLQVGEIDMRDCSIAASTLSTLAMTKALSAIHIGGDAISDDEVRAVAAQHPSLQVYVYRPDGLYRFKIGESVIFWPELR